ncbi:coat protein [ssRNA phage Esthiorhiza.2_19]|uniref:Coat protein n=2 Tax=Leviviricetes TaxID=2842243 RepID=A0A8S5L496_9VIRU|nr:coat protein [ssRNA phage Esthiorhiza.2_19]QDH87793.1 MAG: hypothetical protein H2RhizoLitter491384_000002 [Leviviridae sp.]DAD52157.1 TPA_asm: coat protein [ssRNA phage Esthiorhiza.2_19]
MFSDPVSITYATVAKSLARIGSTDTQSEYKLNDSGVVYDLILSHQFAKRNRAVARLRRDAAVSDPIIPTQNILASMTASITVDFPTAGYTAADAQNLANALIAWATSANILKLINGET